jgi:hypothetical protein
MSTQNVIFPPDDDIVKEITEAFGTFAIGDIEHNIEKKPIAAFILCSCLIDQLACFIYFEPPLPNGRPKYKNETLYKRFINDYLKPYKGLNLYVNLRCKLVHNYTVGQHIKLTSEDAPYEKMSISNTKSVLTAKMMFNELKIIVENLAIELKNSSSQIRKKAIECYKHENNRVIAKDTMKYIIYLPEDADKLVKYFEESLKGGVTKNGTEKWELERIDKIDCEGKGFLISVVLKNGEKNEIIELDHLLDALYPGSNGSQILNWIDYTQQNTPLPDGSQV